MKEINLRKFYPSLYTQDTMVTVPDEVADLLQELTRAEDAQRIRTYRHKAVYSLELLNELREIPSDDLLPEELLEQCSMRELLYQGLLALPHKQRYLPCRDSELEEVLRAVNAGSSNEITIINVMWPEGLRMLNGLTVDADEMNFLAKRMDSFVPMELMKFIAAASVINDMDTCKLINLSFNTERYTLL